MSIEIINPTDKNHWLECRTKDITSTEVAALFGLSPYITEFELWHRKKEGVVAKFEENERMKWGTALQDAIALEVAKEQRWTIRRMDEYMRDKELRAGSSFDFSIEEVIDADPAVVPDCSGLLEIKNVDSLAFRDGWIEDDAGNIEAPLHIEIQVQHQLMVSGRAYAYIGALVGGNKLVLIKREPNPKIFASITAKISAFWKSIASNIPPAANFERDAEFISKLYGYAETGKIVYCGPEMTTMAREYKRLGDIAKDADTARKALKAQMLTAIGDAEKAEGEGFKISASMVSGGPVSYVREGYRDFRITWKKEK